MRYEHKRRPFGPLEWFRVESDGTLTPVSESVVPNEVVNHYYKTDRQATIFAVVATVVLFSVITFLIGPS